MSCKFFIFQPGLWIGEGKIKFSHSPQELRFFTKWTISPEIEGKIHAFQQVEMEHSPEQIRNHFLFSDLSETYFAVQLESEDMGLIEGKGIIKPSTLTWKFERENFEGSESYQLNPDNDELLLSAEYIHDGFSTFIQGRLWRKST